jgi:hypothetical protein
MASERQIAANRRNAQKSTGPHSAAGKKRASRNAYRHGLSIPRSGAGFTRAVEELACSLVREGADASALELAREAARGMLELDRVRRIEVALIARVLAFGRLEPAKIFASQRDEVAWVVQHFLGAKLWKSRPKFAIDRLPEMPTDEAAALGRGGAARAALPAEIAAL